MKKWCVHLHETVCGEVEVEAETENDARKMALVSTHIEWCEDGDTEVDYAKELDDDGEEIE